MSLINLRNCCVALAAILVLSFVPSLPAQGVDDRAGQEDAGAGFLIEKLDTSVRFASDGTSTREQTAEIRLQSEAAVRALGVLSFSFTSDNEQFVIDYVRVRKADGRVIETPASSVQEAPSPVTTAAPMYSDLRIKQIPVRALANGDLLEYKLRWVATKALIPGNFWFAQDFEKSAEVKAETLTIRVPSDKYVKLSSPDVAPQTRDEGGEKIYSWTSSYSPADKKSADEKKAKETKATSDATEHHSVELTTFLNWEEIGRWYSGLAADRAAITPEVQAKADELTKGVTGMEAKERAIYDYVATKYRYISISFGEGRYQPHSAAEVMANLYGDCKDKHTLLTALMKAAGIEVSTVLIGDGLPFNADVPSPAQFNHVIAEIPGAKEIWLDTTTEVAPFGQIVGDLRGHEALLIPPSGSPKIVTTPKEGVVPESETVQFQGALDGDGTLTGHLDVTVGGDAEVVVRSVFHETSPTQWSDVAQNIASGMGYAGKVSAVDIDSPLDTSHRFHFAWDYKREKYGDWANLRIPPPVPAEMLPELPDDPKEDFQAGPANNHYSGEMKLPAGFSVDIPSAVHVTNSAGEYEESYTVTDGVLRWRRTMIVRKDKIHTADREDYSKLMTAVNAGANYMIRLTKTNGAVEVSEDNPRALELLQQATTAMQAKQFSQAGDALRQAELLNPKQRGLWALYATYYGMSGQTPKAIESLRKEVEVHPEEAQVYKALAEAELYAHNQAEAEAAYRKYQDLVPDDVQASIRLAGLLSSDKAYEDALGVLDRAIKLAPDNIDLVRSRTITLLEAGKKQEGVDAAKELQAKIATNDGALNDIGYNLIDTGADLKLGLAMVEKSVAITEEALKDAQLSNLNSDRLAAISRLGATWDSEGWAYYLGGDVSKAERLIEAAWKLIEHGAAADHLGQIYEKLGRKDDAIHMYRLAMAAGNTPADTANRLKALEGPTPVEKTIGKNGSTTVIHIVPRVQPIEELGKLRTVDIPEFSRKTGAAEFFVLFSAKGPEDVRFLSGPDDLRGAKDAILHAKFDMPFGDDGPEKIARRGVLSCSEYTKPNCQLVLLLPSNTTAP